MPIARLFATFRRRMRGLSQRIILSFAALLLLTAALYGSAIWFAIAFTEEHLVAGLLRDELSFAEETLAEGNAPNVPPGTEIFGDDKRLPPIPEALKGIPQGFTEILDDPARFVWRENRPEGTILIVRDQSRFEEAEKEILLFTALSLAVAGLAGALAGWWLSRRIMRPIERLSDAVKRASISSSWTPIPEELQTPDEVGELAAICSRALRRLNDALERERAFTADASHELRTPLTVIETSAELLAAGKLGERERRQVERIHRASREMQSLMETLLEFARASSGRSTEPPDAVRGILRNACDVWKPLAEAKGLAFEADFSETCPGTYSPGMLGIVAANLLRNAVSYTSRGRILLRETSDGFLVADNAPPIKPEDRERIFEAYERGDSPAAPGTGLGLAIVAKAARRSGWKVELESTPEGNIFRVRVFDTGIKGLRADEA